MGMGTILGTSRFLSYKRLASCFSLHKKNNSLLYGTRSDMG